VVQGSNVNVFDVTAQIDSATAVLDPEISANCQVLLKHIPDTIIVPMVAVFDEDSTRVVYVKQKEGKQYLRKPVSVVAQSEFEAVIGQGLQEGDIVSLIKPEDNKIAKDQ
jgi:multidrug efflux pump subunit AcrA (membrane-fusion protein)